jgi:hypothetical protein
MNSTNPVETIALPGWAAASHSRMATQVIFYDQIPLCQFPHNRQTPYSKELPGWYFIYMTNRMQGRYSYLFEKLPTKKELWDLPISMGYTNLWVLKKLTYLSGDKNLLFKDNIITRPKEESVAPGDFIVFQDPLMKTTYHDAVFRGDESMCTKFATDAVKEFRCSLIIAELIYDEYWH